MKDTMPDRSAQQRPPDRSLLDTLTPGQRRHLFRALGVEIRDSHVPDASGWINHLRLPPALGRDANPSVSVNLDTGAVRDHGGNYTADLAKLTQDVRRCTFPEALAWIAAEIGHAPSSAAPAPERKQKKRELQAVPLEDAEAWSLRLMQNEGEVFQAARVYLLTQRGLSPNTVAKYRIGLRKMWNTWWVFFPLVTERTRDGGTVTHWKQIAFDPKGGGWKQKNGRKWVLTCGPGVLYPLASAQYSTAPVVFCEGEIDALTARQQGHNALTGTVGAKGLAKKANLLDRLSTLPGTASGFTLAYDGDSDGTEGAELVAEQLHRRGVAVRIAQLPAGEDVNSILHQEGGAVQLQRALDAAQPFIPAPSADEAAVTTGDNPPNRRTKPGRVLDLLEGAELFHDRNHRAYITLERDGHHETHDLDSSTFRFYLSGLYWQHYRGALGDDAAAKVLEVLKARAVFEGPEIPVHIRTAGTLEAVYVDLCNDAWEAVEITASGWRIVQNAPVKFIRRPGMEALPPPTPGGHLQRLRSHMGLEGDDNAFALLCGWLVMCLHPSGPYPILNLTGEQGTGKSTKTRFLRRLLDPSTTPTEDAPRNPQDLMISAENAWTLAFDNLSDLRDWFSDALCRLSTGGGFKTRRLHSNREQVMFYYKRPVIMNGIVELATRPDLADRSLNLRLPVIPSTQRRQEAEICEAFAADTPHILGGLFDAVATAIRQYPNTQRDELPRMADFMLWSIAAEPAFGVPVGTFEQAFAADRAEATTSRAEADKVTAAIVALLEDTDRDTLGEWEGITSELLEDLKAYLPNPERPGKDYPSSAQGMAAHLKRIMPDLRTLGIDREDNRTSDSRRSRRFQLINLELKKTSSGTSGTSEPAKSGQNQGLFSDVPPDDPDEVPQHVRSTHATTSGVKSAKTHPKTPMSDDPDVPDVPPTSSGFYTPIEPKSDTDHVRNADGLPPSTGPPGPLPDDWAPF